MSCGPFAVAEPLFTARRYVSAAYAVVVCLSVCLSVRSHSSMKTAKHKITQTSSPMAQ